MRAAHTLGGAALGLLLLGGALRAGTAVTQSSTGPLQAEVEAMVSNRGEWGLLGYSLDRNEVLFNVNGDRLRVPASNNKVYSAIWALELLGPDHRLATDLLLAGDVTDGVLRGDLYLRGEVDPAFGYPGIDGDPLNSVRAMARAVQRLGIRRVEGTVIADNSVHEGPAYGPAWPQDTGNGAARYAPTVSGLPFQRNMVRVELRDGAAQTNPAVPEIPVKWESRAGRALAVRRPTDDTVRVRGQASGRGNRYEVGAAEPALLAPAALRAALAELGISVAGPVRLGATPDGARPVHRHYSVPLREMINKLNRESDNFFAEHVWKAAMVKAIGRSSFAAGGPASARFFRRFAGVPYGELWQADGSGLSAQNQTTAHAMVLALRAAHRAPWSEAFHESLAVAGRRDGTLANMFAPGTPAADNLHAKTGYIRNVRTLSGYVRTADGEMVAFAMLYNGPSAGAARTVQQNLGNLLATWRR